MGGLSQTCFLRRQEDGASVYLTHAVDVDFVEVEVVVTSAVVVTVRVTRCDTTTADARLTKRRTITTFILRRVQCLCSFTLCSLVIYTFRRSHDS